MEPNNTRQLSYDLRRLTHMFGRLHEPKEMRKLRKANKTVILVSTLAKNFERRKRIRYFFTIEEKIPELIFVLGKNDNSQLQECLEKENRMFGDLLQLPTNGTYKYLIHTSGGGLDYVTQFRTDVDIVMKIEDDFYEDSNSKALRFSS